MLADVRRFPSSRRLPHFNSAPLAAALSERGIEYVHLPELGGRRPAARDSRNDGWRVAGFRGYADHMAGPEFAAGLGRLLVLAAGRRTAVMCAEAQWWRCHRRLLADALVLGGRAVEHIGSDGRLTHHEPTPFARRDAEGRIAYPAEPTEPLLG